MGRMHDDPRIDPRIKTVLGAFPVMSLGDVDGLIRGLYTLCPYIAGSWPQERYPSSSENNGLLIDLHNNRGAMAYGIEALERRNPLAWPGFATEHDVRGLETAASIARFCRVA